MPYGPFLYPGSTTYPGSAVYPGQGEFEVSKPELNCLIAFDDVSDVAGWIDVSDRVRSFKTSRGRETELQEIDAGTADIVFDNRDRFFMPGVSTPLYPSSSTYPGSETFPGGGSARPMNRLWLRELFNGQTYTLFYGYAENYDFNWIVGSQDEVAVGHFVDEFKVLALDQLPAMSPDSAASYSEVVAFDRPSLYFPCDDATGTNKVEGAVVEPTSVNAFQGSLLWRYGDPGKFTYIAPVRRQLAFTGAALIPGAASVVTNYGTGPIVGDMSKTGNFAVSVSQSALANGTTAAASETADGDVSGSAQFAIEFWLNIAAAPSGSSLTMISSPSDTTPSPKWWIDVTTGGVLDCKVKNSGGTTTTVSSAALTVGNWYHVVWTLESGTAKLYLNGSLANSAAHSGTFAATLSTAGGTTWGLGGGFSAVLKLSNIAFYQTALASDRVLAHYTAGVSRGFIEQRSDVRIGAILDASGSNAARSLRVGQRNITPAFQHGQAPLDEIRNALGAEAGDAMFFASGVVEPASPFAVSPGLVFLDASHRSAAPWNQVQMLFSEGDQDEAARDPYYPHHYRNLVVDYSDGFLYNEVSVTREGGLTQTVADATSQDRFYARPLALSGLKVVNDTEANKIAVAYLAKYKAPMERVTSLQADTSNATTALALLKRELGDRVRVRHNLPAGGQLDQVVFIQRIEVTGTPGHPLQFQFSVSPL